MSYIQRSASTERTVLFRQEAKRKPLPPAPAIIGRGSAFTQEVWQNAALLVDKPKGWTSFDVCAKLRGALKTKKVPQNA